MTESATEKPFRILPRLNDLNRPFWQGGERDELCFLRCQECGFYLHPPAPMCPACHSKKIEPEAVSGDATVASYSINHQPWMPGPELPYVVSVVELPEQEALRLTTNIVGCEPDAVYVGMPVHVIFEHHDDVWIPLFTPREAGA